MPESVTTFTSPVDGMVIEFREWDDEHGVHRIKSRTVGDVQTYEHVSSVESSNKDYYRTGEGGPEAVNVHVQQKLQDNFLRARGVI